MRTINDRFKQMVTEFPCEVKQELELSFAIADKLNMFIKKRGLTKSEFAEAIGKRPSEVTKWFSGQHNFTIRTLSMLSDFFNEAWVVTV